MSQSSKSVNKKINRKKSIVLFMVLLLTSIVSFIILFKTDYLTVQMVQVDGNKWISKEEVGSISGIVKGEHLFKQEMDMIKNNIEKHPYIKTAQVSRKFPDTMVIHVTEREERTVIPFKDQFLVLDDQGIVLRNTSNKGKLKQITGLEFSKFKIGDPLKVKDSEKFKKTLSLMQELKNHNISIEHIYAKDKKNIRVYLTKDLACNLGEGQNLAYRLKVLEEILKDLNQKKIVRGVIDISHEGYPSYSPIDKEGRE